MRIEIEHLGPIRHANLELAQLTVVCGKNNTGKTYLTYAIYGFLKNWISHVPRVRFAGPKLLEEGQMIEDLSTSKNAGSQGINRIAQNFLGSLPAVLAAPEQRFLKTTLKIDLPIDPTLYQEPISQSLNSGRRTGFISFDKPAESSMLTISLASPSDAKILAQTIDRIVTSELARLVYGRQIPSPFIVGTERTGSVTFKSELNLVRNRLIEAAQSFNGDLKPNAVRIMEVLSHSGYPLPVRDNLEFLNSLTLLNKEESAISKSHPEIFTKFSDLIGGDFNVDRQGDLSFKPARSTKLRMNESSSAVRSLVLLGLYLKFVAKPGDLLMIDEPELNLHPENQRKLARLLATLVNAGIKVFITTHSDYIVRELNALIILNNLGESAIPIMEKHGYESQHLLKAEEVRMYTLKQERAKVPGGLRKTQSEVVTLVPVEISETEGMMETTFDNAISDLNQLATDINVTIEMTTEEKHSARR